MCEERGFRPEIFAFRPAQRCAGPRQEPQASSGARFVVFTDCEQETLGLEGQTGFSVGLHFSAQVLSVTLRDIASCPPSSETRPGWCPRDDKKTSEVGGKSVKALPTLEPCGGSVSQGAARRHSRKHFRLLSRVSVAVPSW